MTNRDYEATADQQWVRDRIAAVSERYDAFDALIENGIELEDRVVTMQIQCPLPGHGPDNKPSARFYAADSSGPCHFYCFKCKERLDGIGLLAKLRGMEFMRALSELERRFGVKIARRPDASIEAPVDKSGAYESQAWSDMPRVMEMMEAKLLRMRSHVPLIDYVKWCRLLDAIRWDLDHNGGQPLPQMATALAKLRGVMDKAKQDADV